MASLVVRRRLFLEDPSWHIIPYDLDPSAKKPQSYLLDILTSVPGMLEELSRLELLGETPLAAGAAGIPLHIPEAASPTTARSFLMDMVMQKLTALYRWRWRWQQSFGSEVTAARRRHTSGFQFDETFIKLLGSAGLSRQIDQLNFARPAAAADIMLYNAVLIWLLACK